MVIFSFFVILPEMMIRIPQARQNDSIDADISISTYVVGFIYYGNEAYDDDTVILTRDKLCRFDEWAIKAKKSDGSIIGYIARSHTVALGPILDFLSYHEPTEYSISTKLYAVCQWTHVGQGYPIDIRISCSSSIKEYVMDVLERHNIDWEWEV